MTTEKILTFPAGLELDSLVAEHVMKIKSCHPHTPAPYSRDIAAAWKVVEKIRRFHDCFEVQMYGQKGFGWSIHVHIIPRYKRGKIFPASDESLPLAICRAALMAFLKT